MSRKRTIESSDILDMETYARLRKDRKAEMIAHKRSRRLAIGPNATIHFESFDTMLYQVHEMLFTEGGGADQLKEELEAYQPLIPQGNELVFTLMLEYEDPVIRDRELRRLGGIEETITLEFDGETVQADWEKDVDRTTPDGKTSSVHFLHFRLSPDQAEKLKRTDQRIVVAVGHPNYGHMTVIPEVTRAELAADL